LIIESIFLNSNARKQTSIHSDTSVGGLRHPEGYHIRSPPVTTVYVKKILMHRRNCVSSRLPHAFLSTATAPAPSRRAPPRPHNHYCLATRGCTHPAAVVASIAGTAHWGHRTRPIIGETQPLTRGRIVACPLPSSFSIVTAQLNPAVQCSAYLPGFAEAACCKRMF
jgi:hypothetical protein